LERAAPFTTGATIGTSQSNNGDRSQLFAAYTLPASADAQRSAAVNEPGQAIVRQEAGMSENRVPTTWTTSACECTPGRPAPLLALVALIAAYCTLYGGRCWKRSARRSHRS
jgi:hypothetical protein